MSMFNFIELSTEVLAQLKIAKYFYLVGIKGVGMASLAQCLLDLQKTVGGADVAEEFVTDKILKKYLSHIDLDFDLNLPSNTQVVIYSSAHGGATNPLVVQARTKGILCLNLARALGWLFNQKKGIAVCGVGGKSTVSAMLAWILTQMRVDISFSVGVGEIIKMDRTGRYSTESELFVAEADEYASNLPISPTQNLIPRFAYLQPYITICTNMQFDHPDVYRDMQHTKEVFLEFFMQIKPNGWLIINADDNNLVNLSTQLKLTRPDVRILTFGQTAKADVRLTNPGISQAKSHATLTTKDGNFLLRQQPLGLHNLKNAAAALTGILALDQNLNQAISAISQFRGVGRRLQLISKSSSHLYYDDYAHHPTEIVTTLNTLKQTYPNLPILAIFQPHTVSRTKLLLTEFSTCFSTCDELVLLPIFTSAREQADPNFSIDNLYSAIKRSNPKIKVEVCADPGVVTKKIKQIRKPHIIVTIGAGNVYKLHETIS